MKKEYSLSWKIQLAFVITGIFVGLLITAQFRSAIPAASYPYDEIKAQQELIKSYNDDQNILKSKIANLRKQIDQKQQQASQNTEKNNLDELNKLKKEIGLEMVKGPGIEIFLHDASSQDQNDNKNIDEYRVHAADLRDIVNLLFSAQAEAIAINNQRVIASTPINSVGNTILVNNSHILPPFTITAIGDKDLILQQLNDKNVLLDLRERLKKKKIQFSYEFKNTLIAPIYNGDFRLRYIQEAKNI